jgi:hypothetical protein
MTLFTAKKVARSEKRSQAMFRRSHIVVSLALLGSLLLAPSAFAQTPRLADNRSPKDTSTPEAPNPLPDLPRPPDQPQSLYLGQPAPGYACDPLPGPYFEQDPRLDPPSLPQPGWFGDVEVGAVGPHFKNRLRGTVQAGPRPPDLIHVPGAELDWTASPRVEVGYRLPSGFGDLALSYRSLATDGTGSTLGADGSAFLKSRLDVHILDLDYISRELSLLPHCGMRWRFGLRYVSLFYDSQENDPFGEAAAGSGIFAQQNTNDFKGFGPHADVQVERILEESGFALVARIDGAALLGDTRQVFSEETTNVVPGGPPLGGAVVLHNPQTVPVLNLQFGLGWEPPEYPHTHFFLGYEYEYWWNAARLSTGLSRGELSDQGILLRAEFNF